MSGTASPSADPSGIPGDALAWRLEAAPALARPNSTPYAVATVPSGDLILGAIDDRAAVWVRSINGVWSLAPLQGDTSSSRAVAAAGGNDHAVVAVRDEEGAGSELWLYAAGVWRKIAASGAFPPGWAVRALAWTGEEYVAVGFVSVGDPTTSIDGAVAAAWTSSDGNVWERSELQGPARGSWLISVASGADGTLAGGQVVRDTSDGFLLFRRNGNWQIPDVPNLAENQDESVLLVLSQPAKWFVAGRVSPPECEQSGCVARQTRIWTSPDGQDWTTDDQDASGPSAFGTDGASILGLRQDAAAAVFIASSLDGADWADLTAGHAIPVGALLQAWGVSSQGLLIVGTNESGELLVWEWR